jgi:hypothetical protein
MKISILLRSSLSPHFSRQSIKDRFFGMMGVRGGDTFVAWAMRQVTLWLVRLDSFGEVKNDEEEVGIAMVMVAIPTSSPSLASSPEGYYS